MENRMLSLTLPTIIINAFIIMGMIIGFVETKSPTCLFALLFLLKLPDFTLSEPENYEQYDEHGQEGFGNSDEYGKTGAGFTGSLNKDSLQTK